MRLLRFDPDEIRRIDHHGSVGFDLLRLVKVNGQVVVEIASLTPGGRIGRHPAVVPQLLAVVAGKGTVCGADGAWQGIEVGTAALWEAGEEHETRTDGGLTAVIVEAAELEPLAPER
jgi:quercetin dioxygenase-like cupin family protein